MLNLQTMLLLAGILHFAILSASALVPIVLDWRGNLANVHPFIRQLLWVYGAFVVLTIIAFGILSVVHSQALASGMPLARSLCAFIAIFWAARLGIQFFLFDIKPFVASRFLRLGYHALTVVFAYFVFTYALAAIRPGIL